MSGALKYTIVVRDPDTMGPVALLAGEPVPDWALDLVQPEDYEGAEESSGIPPKSGKGSGAPAWAQYAAANGIEGDLTGKSREEILVLLDAAGIPTE